MTPDLSMYFTLFLIGEVTFIIAAIAVILIPVYTRKELHFGVRIPPEHTNDPEINSMRRGYIIWMSAIFLVVLVAGVLFYLAMPRRTMLLILYQPITLLAAQFFVYLPFWRKSLHLKKEKSWRVSFIGVSGIGASGNGGRGNLREMPYGWYIASSAICLLSVMISLWYYPQLPDILIKHWDINMQPDAWAPKTIGGVIAMPIVAFAMVLLMLGSNVLLYCSKLQVSAENPVLSLAQHRIYRRLISHALGLDALVLAILFLILLPQTLNLVTPDAGSFGVIIFVFTVAMCLPPILISVKAGQAGCKLHPNLSEDEIHKGESLALKVIPSEFIDRSDDRFWKLGLFYYNKNDPSLIVEDRFGSNGGLNYARPVAVLITVCMGILVIATFVFTTWIGATLS